MAKSAPVKVCLECRATYRTSREACPKDGSRLMERDLPSGSVLAGKYRVEEEIGRGGMGVVRRARHIIMDKEVAIKIINPLFSADEAFLDLFKSEARSLAAFSHPGVLTVHDFGCDDRRYFMVMELLSGSSLKDMLTEAGRIPPERALSLLVDICAAVAAAHRAGIVHLDLKGENVFVDETSAGTQVKVLDFGLARLAGATAAKASDGLVLGTVGYMAPEQIRGGYVDERADVYALGVLAFEMLTGSLPFESETKPGILRDQIDGRIRKWPKLAVLKVVPKETCRTIMQALSANPDRRPQSVEELGESFRGALLEIAHTADRIARRHTGAGRKGSVNLFAKAMSIFTKAKRAPSNADTPEGMAFVPAGEFIMGSNRANPDQAPAIKVPLAAFYIDITPVTNRDYARFVEATDHVPPTNWKTVSCPPGTGTLPVTCITWQAAADYAIWGGKRLASEPQWEKAARGADGRPFPWGAEWEPTFANWNGNPRFFGAAEMQPVGSFPDDRSPYGCLDMAGNVVEWTRSWYKPYGPGDFKSEDFGEKFRVVRGGSYNSNDRAYLLCSRRGHARSDTTGAIGFRCVVVAR